jgi:1-acyl-sn-glycerol-3-phosphate acyltransferase
MAELKPQVYKDPRPAEFFDRYYDWAATHPAGWTYEFVRMLITPISILLFRERAIGAENVPASGPVILAPNHFSNMDHFFSGVYIRRKVRFMAKSQLFGNSRILTYIFRVGGVFPVRRGHHDERAFETAHAILSRGECVLMYAEGGRSRTGDLGEVKPGLGRLALESGVPVVPVAIHGSEGVRRWRKLSFPKVTVRYGEPITLPVVSNPTREQQLEAAQRLFEPVRRMHSELREKGRRGVLEGLRAQRRESAARAV